MRQKIVKNAPQSLWVLFIGKRGTFQNASEIRQKCVKNARNTFGGEHLFVDDTEYRALTFILLKSIAIHLPFLSRYFLKSMSSCRKVVYTPPMCITIRLPFVSRRFCRSIRVRFFETPPKTADIVVAKCRRRALVVERPGGP